MRHHQPTGLHSPAIIKEAQTSYRRQKHGEVVEAGFLYSQWDSRRTSAACEIGHKTS
jgi:hypothetical protein